MIKVAPRKPGHSRRVPVAAGRRRVPEVARYVVAIADWDWGVGFGVNDLPSQAEPFNDHRQIEIRGSLARAKHLKVQPSRPSIALAACSAKQLTGLQNWVFQFLYMPLVSFTGQYTVGHATRENVDFITVEAYWQNYPLE
jgi:hypothetical protein